MLGNKLFVIACALVMSIGLIGASEKTIDPHLKAVLEARLASVTPSDIGSDLEKVNRLFETIEALAKRGKEADQSLVVLLDYYLGEGPFADVATAIIERGTRMIQILTERKHHLLSCLPAYESICRDTVENRNNLIDSLIKEIKTTKKEHK